MFWLHVTGAVASFKVWLVALWLFCCWANYVE